MDRFPSGHWYHSGFAPNVATIRASLLLDWTWHWLTPKGRARVRASIRDKGIRRIEPAKDAMANQGVRFNKGLILGRLALADSLDDPALRTQVQMSIDRINGKLDAIIRPDGTFSEGMGYGKGTLAATLLSYHVASRCLDRPIGQLVLDADFERIGPAADVAPANGSLTAGQDSVHRRVSPDYREVPVYRAALTSPAATSHDLLTVIEAIGPDRSGVKEIVTVLVGDVLEVRQGDDVVRVATGRVTPDQLFGCSSDGRLTFAVRSGDKLMVAGAFEATQLETPTAKISGQGFVHWSSPTK